MSFAKQATLATLVISGLVFGLYSFGKNDAGPHAVGREENETSLVAAKKDAAPSKDGAQEAEATREEEPLSGPLSPGQQARDLAPSSAWLVADFRGDITGQKPFAGEPGLCDSVPAPARVVVAVLPPKVGNEPELLIAARKVDDIFWGCARDMIVRAGGTALAQNDRYEVLKSPSGVVARGPEGSLVFLTSEGHLEAALAALSDLTPGAGRLGPHAKLYTRMHPPGSKTEDSTMDLTLALPEDWLSSVGQEKEKTPLRFISSAFLSSHVDGSASGGIECAEAGCAEVLDFLKRAQTDLLAQLPPATRSGIGEALKMKHVTGAGRISLEWDPASVSLGTLLGQFLGAGPLVQ